VTDSASHKSCLDRSQPGSESSSSQRSQSGSRPGSSVSSPSIQRKQPASPSSQSARSHGKKDPRACYWVFMFEQLQRVVDELYETCQADESVDECKVCISYMQKTGGGKVGSVLVFVN